tara:strand:- start:136 stop:324 length:189 start_codon:yes stop_codon:yes gene_type:complete
MIAETAFNVIEALSEKEKTRLLKMLGVEVSNKIVLKRAKKKPLLSRAEATEWLLPRFYPPSS